MPIIRMPDGQQVRFPDDMPKEQIKGMIASKFPDFANQQTPQLKMTDEMKAQAQADAEKMRPEKTLGDKVSEFLVTNPIARQVGFGLQGISNASLNPAGYVARTAGIDTKPLEAQTAGERATELAGQYGFDSAALVPALGLAAGSIPKIAPYAQALTEGGVPLALATSTGGAIAEGITNPTNDFERFLANMAGGGLAGGVIGGLRRTATNTAGGLKEALPNERANAALSKGITADKGVARTISKEAPAVYDELNADMTQALNKATGRKLDIEQANQNARNAYENYIAQNADYPVFNPKSAKEQADENFKRWFEGSQVVDENGQPRRYYHGSLRNFDEFKQANNDYNFAPDKKFAYNYAESKGFEQGIDAEPQLYEVFLNSKKPFDFENPEDIKNLSNYIKGKKIRVFGNPKKEEEFLRNLKGEYYDTKLDEGEFEKLLSDKYNKWYSPDNHDVNYSQSSVNTDKIFSVNPDEEYFITGSAPWGYNIDDVKSSQIEDAIKNLDFGKNKRHQIPVDIETPYGNRVINIDLKRIDKPSAKNLKRGADNWIDIESADFDGEDLLDALKNMGYDGYYKQENGVKNLSVFNPNQIKSVNNSGAWSSSPSLSDAGWKAEPSIKDIKLNQYQQNAMNKALAEGASMSDYPLGSLDATHKAQGVLNDMINASYDSSNPLKPRATTETSQLMSLKKVFNELMEPSGVKPLDARISKAKTLRSNFEKGYNFKPSETKFDNLGLNTARDKKAFLQGRLAKLQDNVLSEGGTNLADAIIKDQNTLKKLMPKKQFDSLMNTAGSLKESFNRLKSIEGQANRELLKDIERGGSPWRENIESEGSLKGRALDVIGNALNKGSRRRLAEAYLNPEISEIRQFGGVKGALKGAGSASLRQALIGNKEK